MSFAGRVVGWVIGKTNGRAEPRDVTLKIRGSFGSLGGLMQRGISFQFQREAPGKLRDEQLEAFFAARVGPDLAVAILGAALDQLDGIVREGEATRPEEERAREALAMAAAFLFALLLRRTGGPQEGAASWLSTALLQPRVFDRGTAAAIAQRAVAIAWSVT